MYCPRRRLGSSRAIRCHPSKRLLPTCSRLRREVLTMLKVGGLSLEEVARATSSTVGAVKQRAHRAYKRLRKLLQSDAGERSMRHLMNCDDVDVALDKGAIFGPPKPEMQEHLYRCARCRKLVAALNMSYIECILRVQEK
jgi:hypothetical protein